MSGVFSWASAAVERVNPIVVKEFRQAVQSRLVVVILTIFLLVNLAVVGGYLLTSPQAATSGTGGQAVFTGLLAVLLFTCGLFVPLYVLVRLSLERNDANIDLFFITALSPGAIVRGKYAAAMALTMLIFSACMPFIVFTYLLRGVDPATIAWALAIGFLACAGFNAVGVFAGCIPASWTLRVLALLALAWLAVCAIAGLMAGIEDMSRRGVGAVFGVAGASEFWPLAGTCLLLELLAIGLLQVFSVAMLSPKPANRMLAPHLYLTALWAITGALSEVWAWHSRFLVPFDVWRCGSCAVFLWLMGGVLGERDTWSARIRKRIPHNPLTRLVAFLFYTGSAGALLWSVGMFALTLWLFDFGSRALAPSMPPSIVAAPEPSKTFWLIAGYVLSYCFTTAVLRMTVLRRVSTVILPLVTTLLGLALLLGPYLLDFLTSDPRRFSSLPWYLIGSPMVLSTGNHPAIAAAETLVTVWVILSGVAAVPWIIGQWLRFTPVGSRE